MSAGRLPAVLRLNAILTAASGAILTAFAVPVDTMLGTGRPGIVRLIGVGLLVFALDVALVARARPAVLRSGAMAILAADVGWVAGSGATVAAGWYRPTGAAAVIAVATVVAGLAAAEWRALRSIPSGSAIAPSTPAAHA